MCCSLFATPHETDLMNIYHEIRINIYICHVLISNCHVNFADIMRLLIYAVMFFFFRFPTDYASRGSKKFGDKCVSTNECGFPGSVCDPKMRSCQCIEELPVTNHLDKCGKGKAIIVFMPIYTCVYTVLFAWFCFLHFLRWNH